MSSEERSTIYASIVSMVEPCPLCRRAVQGGDDVARARPSQPWWHAECYDLVCSTVARRVGMTDEEFWEDVARMLGANVDPPEGPDFGDPEFESLTREPCLLCGAVGECGTDSEGRPMIHVLEDVDAD
jgi:hypothetical protein